MKTAERRLFRIRFACGCGTFITSFAMASTDVRGSAKSDAAAHFQRAVGLYSETDYGAALIEFRRAYELSPNSAVLYNIAETEFQIQDYAAALAAFERYLTQAPPGDMRRLEVERTLGTLRARVGRVSISTTPVGADVFIDEQPVGKTPFLTPMVVSVGHRKVTVALTGRAPTTRYIDVAADDNESVAVQLEEPLDSRPQTHVPLPVEATPDQHASSLGSAWRTVGWTATGALAAGAVVFGVLALTAENQLRDAKVVYPQDPSVLNNDAHRVRTFSAIADTLTAGGIVVGGVTLWSTIASHQKRSDDVVMRPQLTVSPGSLHMGVIF